MKIKFLILVCLLPVITLATHAEAVSCYPFERLIQDSKVVFLGEVLSIKDRVISPSEKPGFEQSKIRLTEGVPEEYHKRILDLWMGDPLLTKFHIIKMYKGQLSEEIEIAHQSQSVGGMAFEPGEKYIVVPSKAKDYAPGLYSAGRCTVMRVVKSLEELEHKLMLTNKMR